MSSEGPLPLRGWHLGRGHLRHRLHLCIQELPQLLGKRSHRKGLLYEVDTFTEDPSAA